MGEHNHDHGEHVVGTMDITAQEKTFAASMRFGAIFTGVVILLLIFLASCVA